MGKEGGGDEQMHKCLCSLRAVCIVPSHFNDTATRLLFTPVPKQAPHSFVGLLSMSYFCRTSVLWVNAGLS